MQGLLIVDGDNTLATALASYLGHEGFDALPASSESEAVESLRHADPLPAAIVLDIDSASHRGSELLRALKNKEWENIPLIVVRDGQCGRSKEMDRAQHILNKPVAMADLVAILQHYCRRSA